ncbi:MAG: flagellar filament capping protein FliD [Nitrosomonadales bacterium]|nr:flagellar filament capping protein FliD [Nitrosomonadales bacterium]
MATSGIGSSSLDVNSIVSQLMAVEQRPLTALAKREASYQAKISAFGSIQGALASFQSAVQGVNSASQFQAFKATSSDSATVGATASSTAVAGSYSLAVTTLAQQQKLVAAGQTSATAAIGSGASTTLSFDFGTISGATPVSGKYTGATFTSNGSGIKTVTIDSTNHSLQGIRDAINAASIGITATIINDGGASPYRLALTSNNAGQTNSIKVSVSGDATLSGLLAHDPGGLPAAQNFTETATAQNAAFTVDGVSISKTSNTVSDVIGGVTLTLSKTTASPVTVGVALDSASIQSAVDGFVKAYNDLGKTLADLSSYNSATKQGAVLMGDAAVRSLQNQMRGILNTPVGNVAGAYTTLSQIGVSFQKSGSLAVDSAKLSSAIASHPGDIADLFAAVGKSSDSLVSYTSATSATKPGSYALTVTQLATQGNLAGNTAAGLTITGGVNDALSVVLDSVSASVTLAAGTYTAAALAAETQSKINGASALSSAGKAVAVTQSAGVMTITSNSYGTSSAVEVTGNGASGLLGGAPVATAGVNAAGTLGGASLSGSGQTLTSSSGDSAGLSLRVLGGATGARGTISYSQGYAYLLNNLATTTLASDGSLSSRTSGLGDSIKDIGKQRDALNLRLANIEKRYRAQFTALDTMLSSMSTTSNFLTQQLTIIQNQTNN